MEHICEFCHQSFTSNWPAAKFCCAAHKQAAYRARVKAEQEKPETLSGARHTDDRTPVKKAVETKRNEQRWKYCKHCGEQFAVNGLQKRRVFCSDGCKQANYRLRNAWLLEKFPGVNFPVKRETMRIEDNVSEIVKEAWSETLDD